MEAEINVAETTIITGIETEETAIILIIIITIITAIIKGVAKKLTNRIVSERGPQETVMMHPITVTMKQKKNIT